MITSKDILKNYISIGEGKSKLPIGRATVLSVLAGMFIALAGIGASVASCMVDNPSIAKLISGCVFPAGLAMVVLTGSELFTGDSLMIISVLSRRVSILKMLRTWIIVYIGNLIGSMIVVLAVVYGHTLSMFDSSLAASLVATASSKCALSFGDAFLRGIMCNVLVCIAVWMGMSAKSAGGKVIALFLPIMVFVICGFEHSVANMFYIPAGILASAEYGIHADGLNWIAFFINNEIPVTLGNIVGGTGLGCALWIGNK